MSDLESGQPATPNPELEPTLAPPAAPAGSFSAPVTTAPAARHDGRRGLAAAIIAAIVLATSGGIGIGWNLAHLISSHSTSSTHASIQTVPAQGGSKSADPASVAARVIPAVVDINTTIQTSSATEQAAGSGLIITSSGDILTNNHVVDGSINLRVTIQGRSGTYTANVVGVDPGDDLAVIHVSGVSGLPTVTLANSSSVKVGDPVLAIGNALGLGGTPRVTQGYITDLDQTITASENGSNSETLHGMIQSDAEISPGDSGGALVNTAGQVIGIITAGEATSFRTTTSTVAYAIPSSTAAQIANQILSGQPGGGVIIGPVGHLGVGVETLDSETAAQLGLSVSSGALVRTVENGSPAASAGIQPGAVIVGINSTTITGSPSLGQALQQFKPGDTVKVTWVDQGGTRSANVTLTTGPAV
jgi:S1-C subfamily serine protease